MTYDDSGGATNNNNTSNQNKNAIITTMSVGKVNNINVVKAAIIARIAITITTLLIIAIMNNETVMLTV